VSVVEVRRNDEFSYTPTEAARVLRVSPTRVRQLLQDGELEGQRDEAGHWLIPAAVVHERLERLRRESFLEAVGYDPLSVREMRGLIEDLRGQVEMLRAELQEAHAANRENRQIIAALTQRIPTLEPPRERTAAQGPPEATESGGEMRERADPVPATGDAREDAEQPRKRGFWRRLFGG
jgi:excisionase family DNA binding protein